MAVFIQKGDTYLTVAQATKRGLSIYNLEMAAHMRAALQVVDNAAYETWALGWISDNELNTANNAFNLALERYRKATQRLAKYALSVGREAVYEDQETSEFDEDGNALTASVLIQSAIEPLSATVTITVYDEETDTSSEQDVLNPLIKTDETERNQSTTIVNATPTEVKNFEINTNNKEVI